jgi:hypothetical protein
MDYYYRKNTRSIQQFSNLMTKPKHKTVIR